MWWVMDWIVMCTARMVVRYARDLASTSISQSSLSRKSKLLAYVVLHVGNDWLLL